jgi:CheY-like chemotaxis protein
MYSQATLRQIMVCLVFAVVYLCLFVQGMAVPDKPLEFYKQRIYTSIDGLPQNSIGPITQTPDRLKLHIQLRDTGIGIAREQGESIFEVFQQGDGSITHKYGGVGLGLAISKQIAALRGGTIWVKSEPGKGSTFKELPGEKKDTRRNQGSETMEKNQEINREKPGMGNEITVNQTAVEEGVRSSVYILLAEDNPLNQKLARYILIKGGCRLEVVDNGKEAVETYCADPGKFHLIFMDVNMPGMDGREASRLIREKGYTKVPIIAMTAHALKEDQEKCLAAGMNDYITKPIKREIIFDMIDKWVLKGR